MIVSMYMATDVASANPHTDISHVVQLMATHSVRCVPVVEDNTLVGIVSKSDVLHLARNHLNPFSAEARARSNMGFTVAEAMSRSVATISPDAPIEAAAELLDTKRVSVLVVVKDRTVVGMLSRTDILRAFREIVFSTRATRFTLLADEGIDIAGTVLSDCRAHGLELAAYLEHRHNDRRYVFISILGPRETIEQTIEAAWLTGVTLLQVQRPDPGG